MAIAFNLPGIPSQIRGTAEEAGAVPDLGQAMMQGFRSNIENVQGYPRQLAQQLLSNQLANKIRGVEAQYAEPMAKTKYDQALANLQHQGLINKYYPQLMESQLTTAGLSQAHQRMANERAQMDLNIYKDAYNAFKNQGATHEQAHQAAVNAVQQQSATREPVVPEFTQMLTGKAMPEYLSNLVQQQPQTQQTMPQQMLPMTGEGYSPMQENLFGPQYSQKPFEMELQKAPSMAMELTPTLKAGEMPEYLQRPMEMELSSSLPVEMSAQQQVPQEQMQPQSYVEQLQQQGYNTDNFNPQNAGADELYLKSPLHRAIIEKMAPGTGIKRYNDFPRNRQIVTTTLPSGATKTTIEPLGGAQGGENAFKGASQTGRVYEDIFNLEKLGKQKEADDLRKTLIEKENEKDELERLFKRRDEYRQSGDEEKLRDTEARIKKITNLAVMKQEPAPPKGATAVFDQDNNYIGYDLAPTEKEKDRERSLARFNTYYPVVNKGLSSYRGNALDVLNAITKDVENQNYDKNAAQRLQDFVLALNSLSPLSASELNVLAAPKVRNVINDLKKSLGTTSLPDLAQTLITKYGINSDIQNRAFTNFGTLTRKAAAAEKQAVEGMQPKFVPARRVQGLQATINQGATKANAKAKGGNVWRKDETGKLVRA